MLSSQSSLQTYKIQKSLMYKTNVLLQFFFNFFIGASDYANTNANANLGKRLTIFLQKNY